MLLFRKKYPCLRVGPGKGIHTDQRMQKKFIPLSFLVQTWLQLYVWKFLLLLHVLNLFKIKEIEEVPLEVLGRQFESKFLNFSNERLNRILLPLEPRLKLCNLQHASHLQNSAGFKYEVPGFGKWGKVYGNKLLNTLPSIGPHKSKAEHSHINSTRIKWNIGHVACNHLGGLNSANILRDQYHLIMGCNQVKTVNSGSMDTLCKSRLPTSKISNNSLLWKFLHFSYDQVQWVQRPLVSLDSIPEDLE